MYKIILIGVSLLPVVLGTNSYGADKGYGQSIGYYSKNGYEAPYEEHYPPQPYKFGYDIKDGYGGGLFQKEEGDAYGNKKGSYGYTDSYGIYRQVDYIADKHGFRATIKTNEPGTANQNPASVYIHSDAAPAHYGSDASDGGYTSDSVSSGYKTSSYSAPNQIISGLYKSASYSVPSYITKQPPIIKSMTSSSPIYQMPAYFLAPKTIYKNVPFGSNNAQLSNLYGISVSTSPLSSSKNSQKY